MIIWFVFYISILFFVGIYTLSKKKTPQKWCLVSICSILIYFSAFREGLGQDYAQYVRRIEYLSSINNLNLFMEPLFNVLGYIIENTHFSYVLLFLVSAIVANVGIVSFCSKEKKYFPYMIFLFVLWPVLYQQSFNLVRQFFAIGIFYYSLRFIGVSLWRYVLYVLLAGTMHLSALFLIPLYWMVNKKYKRYWMVISAMALVSSMPFILDVVSHYERYDDYARTTLNINSSGFTMIYNILLAIVSTNQKIYREVNPVYFNLLFLLVLFIDLSFINYGFYRLSLFFIPIVIYIIPFVFDKILDKCLTILILLGLLIISIDNINANYSSSGLLPLSALFD